MVTAPPRLVQHTATGTQKDKLSVFLAAICVTLTTDNMFLTDCFSTTDLLFLDIILNDPATGRVQTTVNKYKKKG